MLLASATTITAEGAVGREGTLDLSEVERAVQRLEQLLDRAGNGNVDARDALVLLDEATKLRDGIAREVRAIRRALEQDRRRHRAHRIYRQGHG